jgi:hypothetical protein
MLGADDELVPEFPICLVGECDAKCLDFHTHVDVKITIVYMLHPILITV